MNFEEHAAKPLLRAAGIATPKGALAASAAEAGRLAAEIGPCVLKAQVPTGKRGKAGGIKLATDAGRGAGRRIRHPRHDDRASIASRSCWSKRRCRSRARCMPPCSTIPRPRARCCCSRAQGGMDIEEIAAAHPGAWCACPSTSARGSTPRHWSRAAGRSALRSRSPGRALLARSTRSTPATTPSWWRSTRWCVTQGRRTRRARLQADDRRQRASRATKRWPKPGTPEQADRARGARQGAWASSSSSSTAASACSPTAPASP